MYYLIALSWQRQCLSALRSDNGARGFAVQRNDKPSPVFANHQKNDKTDAVKRKAKVGIARPTFATKQ